MGIKEYVCEQLLNEAGPIGGIDDGALKFVFKFPKEGKFTANFLDGKSATFDVDTGDKSSGRFAFVTKSGNVVQTWPSKPSRDTAFKVLQRVKSPLTKV